LANTAVVYGRDYNGKKLNFEASGGLMHSSLVMQDFETDSYWAIMSGEAIAGEFKGTKLRELPIGEKMRWKDWKKKYPNTLVLSVRGREDAPDVYRNYFASSSGFRGSSARDKRFNTKEPIFSFHYNGQSYAVSHKKLVGGKTFDLGDVQLLMYRPEGASFFQSTVVYQSNGSGFMKENGEWIHVESGCKFDPNDGTFKGDPEACPKKFIGFDTFWYNWSLSNPETKILD
jgi:hypothetical protein